MLRVFKNIKDRLKEPSTYAGLSALAFVLEDLNVINEAQVVNDTTIEIATHVSQGNFIGASLAAAFGLLAIFKSEKGKNHV